jgi:hypothetical protein
MNRRNRKLFETCDSIVGSTLKGVSIQIGVSI